MVSAEALEYLKTHFRPGLSALIGAILFMAFYFKLKDKKKNWWLLLIAGLFFIVFIFEMVDIFSR